MRRLSVVIAFATGTACAQQSLEAWLDSKPAADFRARVAQLALIYGESNGIDLRDFKVRAREVAKKDAGCSDVEVVTSKGGRVVRRETVRACHEERPRHSPG